MQASWRWRASSRPIRKPSRRLRVSTGSPPEEHSRFTGLNTTYTKKFGFPFIIAVKGLTKEDILAAFERRIDNSKEEEFETACAEVERIARLRLRSMLPGDDNA